MKILVMIMLLMPLSVLIGQTAADNSSNPFFQEWTNPYGTPPFDQIKNEHFMPAYLEGMKQQKTEIDAIINNPEKPDFKNTVEALEVSGEILQKLLQRRKDSNRRIGQEEWRHS